MSKINQIENLTEIYINCAKLYANLPDTRSHFSEGINDDCSKIFETINIEELEHQDFSLLPYFLTKILRIRITSDHKKFWTWFGFLINKSYESDLKQLEIFRDDWFSAFLSLLHLVTASTRNNKNNQQDYNSKLLEYVNYHLFSLKAFRYTIADPLAFALLEGLLRRKNYKYVNKNGIVLQPFTITDSNGKKVKKNKGDPLNNISHSLRLFIQYSIQERKREVVGFVELDKEIQTLTGEKDVYNFIESRRNNLLHGNEYWRSSTPYILNLICLLIIDEIDPAIYNSNIPKIQEQLRFIQKHSPYPPDLDNSW